MIPPIDTRYIAEELARIGDALKEAAEDTERFEGESQALVDALRASLNALCQPPKEALALDPEPPRGPGLRDKTALGAHGIDLLVRLAALAERLRRPELVREIEILSVPLACWIARCDGEILQLEPIVNGVAALANRLKQPQQLAQLYGLLREISFAVSPLLTQPPARPSDPGAPWPLFLLNKAIIATRSHRPEFMEEAFEHLVDQLPETAEAFFREGMEQMGALDYPTDVKVMMEHWFAQWCALRTLH